MGSTGDKLITLTDAAAYLAEKHGLEVSRGSLKRWAKRGVRGVRLEHRIIGDWYYTRRSWVDAFVLSREGTHPAPAAVGYTPVDLSASHEARNELQRRGRIGERKAKPVLGVRPAG